MAGRIPRPVQSMIKPVIELVVGASAVPSAGAAAAAGAKGSRKPVTGITTSDIPAIGTS